MATEPTLDRSVASSRGAVVAAPVIAAAIAILLGACGSSRPTGAATTGSDGGALAAARCMRAHGVSKFPDPRPGGGMTVLRSPGGADITIDGIVFSGPAFQAAEKICKPLGNPGAGNPPVSEQQKRMLLGFARCMRRHGIAYADPRFPAGGGIFGGGGGADSGQGTRSPAFTHAAASCNAAMPSGSPG